MRKHRLPTFILILAFAVGQWLAVVHATHHELTSSQESATCELCAVAHGAGALPVIVALLLTFTFRDVAPVARRIGVAVRKICLLPPSRGPPLFPR
jgi:hypothetical protein